MSTRPSCRACTRRETARGGDRERSRGAGALRRGAARGRPASGLKRERPDKFPCATPRHHRSSDFVTGAGRPVADRSRRSGGLDAEPVAEKRCRRQPEDPFRTCSSRISPATSTWTSSGVPAGQAATTMTPASSNPQAQTGTRTPDPFLTMEVLYQLSYLGSTGQAPERGILGPPPGPHLDALPPPRLARAWPRDSLRGRAQREQDDPVRPPAPQRHPTPAMREQDAPVPRPGAQRHRAPDRPAPIPAESPSPTHPAPPPFTSSYTETCLSLAAL